MDEKRAEGLCYWYAERFIPGHKCRKKQLFMIQIKEVIEEDEMEEAVNNLEEGDECLQEGQLSLNALWGTGSNQTMMLKGLCGKVGLHVHVATGSTHNFINEQVIKKLDYPVQEVNGIWVEIANGQEMKCNSLCKDFVWKMQDQEFKADVYLLPLDNYDLILGIQ